MQHITHHALPHLSHREMQCLQSILNGYASKQIASELSLSYRTVENYLATLKQKLNCHRKSDLLKKAKTLAAEGILDIS